MKNGAMVDAWGVLAESQDPIATGLRHVKDLFIGAESDSRRIGKRLVRQRDQQQRFRVDDKDAAPRIL